MQRAHLESLTQVFMCRLDHRELPGGRWHAVRNLIVDVKHTDDVADADLPSVSMSSIKSSSEYKLA